MEKSTHTERVAVALAMRAACAAACAGNAPAKEADGYRSGDDTWRAAASVCGKVDPLEVVAALDGKPEETPGEREAFELAAKSTFFSVEKRDNGDYFHPITDRAYKVWQMAMQFKAGAPMTDVAPQPPKDASKVTVTIAGMPASMPVADAELLGIAPDPAPQAAVAPEVPGYMLTAAEDPATPPTLRLGQISERFGFQVTAAFLSSLGFEPAGRDKNAVLFHDSQFNAIGTLIKAHIDAVMAKF